MIINLEEMDLSQIKDEKIAVVLICLFTDAYVEPDELPTHIAENRGWWGDVIEITINDKKEKINWGSKLWLLETAKMTGQIVKDAHDYCLEALQPLIQANIIVEPEIIVQAEDNRLNLQIIFADQTLEIQGL